MPSFHSHCRWSALAFLCAVFAFSSWGLADDAGRTRVVEDSSGVFTVTFPAAATQSGGVGKSADQEQQQFTLSTDRGVYMLVYEDFPRLDFSDKAVATKAIKTAQEGFRKSLNGELLGERKIGLPGTGVSGLEFELHIPRLNGQSRHRSVAIGHRWYSVLVLGTKDFVKSAEADRFLQSATIVASSTQRAGAHGPAADQSSTAAGSSPENRGRTRIRNLIRQRGGK